MTTILNCQKKHSPVSANERRAIQKLIGLGRTLPPFIALPDPTAGGPTDGVPREIDRHEERTVPLAAAGGLRGPTHAELHGIADGKSGSLTLADRYLVERRLGRGGMAAVYAGRLLSLDRPVAIKILNEDLRYRDDRLKRFVAEVDMASHLRHPNIVGILDFGSTEEGVVFMIMELLEGVDLHTMIRREGPLAWPRVQELMRDICCGLVAVHNAGLVHRDIKPANCFYADGVVKLLDFGVATLSSAQESTDPLRVDGRVIGTPAYMSPEQARGGPVDARSDIYAAGILLGELLTGRVPFENRSPTSVIAAQIYESPPTLHELGGEDFEVVALVEAIYARALSKDPKDRFATIEAFAAAIAAVTPASAHPRWWQKTRRSVMAAAIVLAGLVSTVPV